MRQVKDKVAFFERHLNNGDDDSQGRRRSGSLAESTESFHSGDETPSPEKIEKPGKTQVITKCCENLVPLWTNSTLNLAMSLRRCAVTSCRDKKIC